MSSHYLFVYGTLRRDSGTEWSRRLAANPEFIGSGHVPGTLFEIGSYRGMVPAQSENDSVVGEVFQVVDPAAFWPILDEYEGDEFERREVPVRLDDGNIMNAWVYYYRGDTAGQSRVLSGDGL
jgi:gamma-glutamylcyclotransferase (GGCT)/AIG2-like uncharacterized protein YtfP